MKAQMARTLAASILFEFVCFFFTQLQGLGPAHWEAAGKGSEGEQKVKLCWEEKNGEKVTTFWGVCELREENVGIMCGREEKEGFQKFLVLAAS